MTADLPPVTITPQSSPHSGPWVEVQITRDAAEDAAAQLLRMFAADLPALGEIATAACSPCPRTEAVEVLAGMLQRVSLTATPAQADSIAADAQAAADGEVAV